MISMMMVLLVLAPAGAKINPKSGSQYLWDERLAEHKTRKAFANPRSLCRIAQNRLTKKGLPKFRKLCEKYGLCEQAMHIVLKYASLCCGELTELINHFITILGREQNWDDRDKMDFAVEGAVQSKVSWLSGWVVKKAIDLVELIGLLDNNFRDAHVIIKEEFRYAGESIDKMYRGMRYLARPYAKKHGFDSSSTWKKKTLPKPQVVHVPYGAPDNLTPVQAKPIFGDLLWQVSTVILAVLLLFSCCLNCYQCSGGCKSDTDRSVPARRTPRQEEEAPSRRRTRHHRKRRKSRRRSRHPRSRARTLLSSGPDLEDPRPSRF